MQMMEVVSKMPNPMKVNQANLLSVLVFALSVSYPRILSNFQWAVKAEIHKSLPGTAFAHEIRLRSRSRIAVLNSTKFTVGCSFAILTLKIRIWSLYYKILRIFTCETVKLFFQLGATEKQHYSAHTILVSFDDFRSYQVFFSSRLTNPYWQILENSSIHFLEISFFRPGNSRSWARRFYWKAHPYEYNEYLFSF